MGKAKTLLLLGVIGAVVAATILVIEKQNKKTDPNPKPNPDPNPEQPEQPEQPNPEQPVIPNFKYSGYVAVDSKGNIYVSDKGNNVVCKITYKGNAVNVTNLTTIFEDTAHPSFKNPSGVAVDSKGNVYVADTGNSLVRKIDAKTGVVTNLGKTFKDKKNKSFKNPNGVAVDGDGNVYVADYENRLVRKIDTKGNVTNLGKYFKNNSGLLEILDYQGQVIREGSKEPLFRSLNSVAVDSAGNVYVTDIGRMSILYKIDADGIVTNLETTFLDPNQSFKTPCGVAVDSKGNVYVADVVNRLVYKIDTDGVATNLGTKFLDPDLSFKFPVGVAVDSTGIVYVVDVETNFLSKIENGDVTPIY